MTSGSPLQIVLKTSSTGSTALKAQLARNNRDFCRRESRIKGLGDFTSTTVSTPEGARASRSTCTPKIEQL
jgi:hypothetical protein